MRPFPRGRVDVHAGDRRGRKSVQEKTLDLLRAEPALLQCATSALAAHGTQRLLVTTVMAKESLRRAMVRQRDAAVRTHHDIAAFTALHERRIAAPVEEQDALLTT